MRRYSKMLFFIAFAFLVITCKKQEKPEKETILAGKATVLVDETLTPIIEDQVQIFENIYDAKITIEPKSEAEVIQALVRDSSRIAILTRKLTAQEEKVFAAKKLVPKITPFAKDAIALITNKNNKDTLIALQQVIEMMQGKNKTRFKGLVFDNPNSSTARYLCELAQISSLPENGVFSFNTNKEVIKYVSENDGMIGVIGINYMYQPTADIKTFTDKVQVLSVKGNENSYYSPTQNDIAEGKYPLARDLYVANCQGYSGLGMGFASFIAGETGQRIILKSGLVPIRVPSRKILIRNQVTNDKK
jgi:phosphate transport system substrate-binding protein